MSSSQPATQSASPKRPTTSVQNSGSSGSSSAIRVSPRTPSSTQAEGAPEDRFERSSGTSSHTDMMAGIRALRTSWLAQRNSNTSTGTTEPKEFADGWDQVQSQQDQATRELSQAHRRHEHQAKALHDYEQQAQSRAGEHREHLQGAQERYKTLLRKADRTDEEEQRLKELGQKIDDFDSESLYEATRRRPSQSFTELARSEYEAELAKQSKQSRLDSLDQQDHSYQERFDGLDEQAQDRVLTEQLKNRLAEDKAEGMKDLVQAVKNGETWPMDALVEGGYQGEIKDLLNPENGKVQDPDLADAAREFLRENVDSNSPPYLQRLRQTEAIEGRISGGGKSGEATLTDEQREAFINDWTSLQPGENGRPDPKEQELRERFEQLSPEQQSLLGQSIRKKQFQDKWEGDNFQARQDVFRSIEKGETWALEALSELPPEAVGWSARGRFAEAVHEKFAKTEDPDTRARLAAHVLQRDSLREADPAVIKEAFRLTRQQAGEGDIMAIKSLAKVPGLVGLLEQNEYGELRLQAAGDLEQLINGGRGEEVNQALLRSVAQERDGYDKHSDRDTLRLLGQSAATLPAASDGNQQTRDVLTQQLKQEGFDPNDERKKGAIEGLDALSATLGEAELSALGDFVAGNNPELSTMAGQAFANSLEALQPEARQAVVRGVMDRMFDNAQENYDQNRNRSDKVREQGEALGKKVELLAPYLGNDDISKLASARYLSSHQKQNLFGQIVANDKVDGAVKDQIVRQMAEHHVKPTGENLSKLVDYVQSKGDPELKQLMLDKLVAKPPELGGIPDEVGQDIMQRMARIGLRSLAAGQTGDLAEFGKWIKMRQMAEDPDFKGLIDVEEVDRNIRDMLENNKVVNQVFTSTSQTVTDDWRASREGQKTADSQMNWLKSADFQARLRLADPEEKQQLMNDELLKVQVFAPGKLDEARDIIGSHAIADATQNPLQGMENLPPLQREERFNEYFQAAFGFGQLTYKNAVQGFVGELSKDLARLQDGKDIGALRRRMLQIAEKHGLDESALNRLSNGRLDAVMMGFGVSNLLRSFGNGDPKNIDDCLNLGGAIAGIAGNTPGTLKVSAELLGLSKQAGNFVSSSGLLKSATSVLKYAGPIGDAVGAAQDFRSAMERFDRKDTTSGTLYVAAGTAGAASAILGTVALLAPAGVAAGPAGWAALGLGIGAAGVSFAASMMRESEEIGLAREMNAFTPLGAARFGLKGWIDDKQLVREIRNLSETDFEKLERDYLDRFGSELRTDLRNSGLWDFLLRQGSLGLLDWLNS